MNPNFPKHFFVTGIGTDVGKTVASAVLCKALNADYWKPIQAGGLDFTDSDFLKQFGISTHKETFRLNTPASPHFAAAVDGVEIELNNFEMPETPNRLLIEGAGGVMVPINHSELILDLIVELDLPVVVVSRNYLGSINHTLLTCEMLNAAGVEILGIVFNGDENVATEEFILSYTNLNNFGRIPMMSEVNDAQISAVAKQLQENIGKYFNF